MRLPVLVTMALLVHLAGGGSWARTPRSCRRCQTACGDAVSACVEDAVSSCPAAPRGKARRCALKAKRRCKKQTTARCVSSCKQTGSPECGPTAPPSVCAPYTSTCAAVPVTPAAVPSPFGDQLAYGFTAITGSPGPGSCCVIDECAGTTQFDTGAGGVDLEYHEVVYLDAGSREPTNGQITTRTGVSCPVRIPTAVYGSSNIYRVTFNVEPRFTLPPAAPAWIAPYVASPGDLAVSIDSANDPLASDASNSFTPSTWRFVGQTVGVDKVCAEQQLMEGHATATFVKTDGTSCTVTIYAQGTRVVSP